MATAVASAVAYAIALSFESSVCPNIYANDCNGRGAVALLSWGAYVGPELVASFGLGPIRGRSWPSFFALPLAGLIGLGIAAAPSAIEDAHIDGDVLFAYVVLWPFFAMPLVSLRYLARWLDPRYLALRRRPMARAPVQPHLRRQC